MARLNNQIELLLILLAALIGALLILAVVIFTMLIYFTCCFTKTKDNKPSTHLMQNTIEQNNAVESPNVKPTSCDEANVENELYGFL
jgi:hypothetical protein